MPQPVKAFVEDLLCALVQNTPERLIAQGRPLLALVDFLVDARNVGLELLVQLLQLHF